MNYSHQELTDLITELVTGDSAQMENLSMSDKEWKKALKNVEANGDGDYDNFPITLSFDLWMRLVKVAQAANGD